MGVCLGRALGPGLVRASSARHFDPSRPESIGGFLFWMGRLARGESGVSNPGLGLLIGPLVGKIWMYWPASYPVAMKAATDTELEP